MRHGRVMKVVAMLGEVFMKLRVILPAEDLQQFGPGFGDIDAPSRLVGAEPFRGGARVAAKIGVGRNGGAVRVERINVSGDYFVVISGIALKAVENRVEAAPMEKLQVLQKNVSGHRACDAQGERAEVGLIDGRHGVARDETLHDLVEIAGQGPLPAEGIDVGLEAGRDKFLETAHDFDASIVGRQREARYSG